MKALKTEAWCAKVKCSEGDYLHLSSIASQPNLSDELFRIQIKALVGKTPPKRIYRIVKVEIKEVK